MWFLITLDLTTIPILLTTPHHPHHHHHSHLSPTTQHPSHRPSTTLPLASSTPTTPIQRHHHHHLFMSLTMLSTHSATIHTTHGYSPQPAKTKAVHHHHLSCMTLTMRRKSQHHSPLSPTTTNPHQQRPSSTHRHRNRLSRMPLGPSSHHHGSHLNPHKLSWVVKSSFVY